MNNYTNYIKAISNLRTDLNDRLYIKEGHLELVEGSHRRTLGLSITPKPEELAKHIEEKILKAAQAQLEALKGALKKDTTHYEELANLRREVKTIYNIASDLQYTFRGHDYSSKKFADIYSSLCSKAAALSKEIQEYKRTLKKPLESEKQVRHFEYTERTSLNRINFLPSKRVPLEDITNAAKKALAMHKKDPFKGTVGKIRLIGRALLYSVPLMGASILHAFKLLLWDPIEKLIKGERVTESPFDKLVRKAFLEKDTHERAFQKLFDQLLRNPVISNEVIKLALELLPHAKELNMTLVHLAAEKPSQLRSFIKEKKLPLDTFLTSLDAICLEKKIPLVSLEDVERQYAISNRKFLVTGKFEAATGQFANRLLPDQNQIVITLDKLKILLDAAAKSPTCKEVSFSTELLQTSCVQEFLTSKGFKESKKYYSLNKIYERK